MVKELSFVLPCAMPAEDFWSLRSDTGFDEYFCRQDGQIYELLHNSVSRDATGHDCISREYKLSVRDNPVPKFARGALPKVDDFAFRVKCPLTRLVN